VIYKKAVKCLLQVLATSFFIIIVFSLQQNVYADDANYMGKGVDVYPVENNDIQLVSETIVITDSFALNSPGHSGGDRWTVHVDMEFKNHGDAATVQMGFPVYGRISPKFRTWVDGREVAIEEKNGLPSPLGGRYSEMPRQVYTYLVSFEKGETKQIVHSYAVGGYSAYYFGSRITYVLRTGALWKGPIEDLKIYYRTHVSLAPKITCVQPREHGAKVEGNELVFQWHFKDYEPEEDFSISHYIAKGKYYIDEIDIEKHREGRGNLIYFSKDPMCAYRLIRNKVFAMYGYPFRNPYMRSLFYHPESQYAEDPSYSFDGISEEHKTLLDFVLKAEKWHAKHRVSIFRELAHPRDAHYYLTKLVRMDEKPSSYIKMRPLLLDHRNNRLLVAISGGNKNIPGTYFLSLDDYIPEEKISVYLLMKIGGGVRGTAIVSPDGKYVVVRGSRSISILDVDSMEYVSSPEMASHEPASSQFSRDSRLLYSVEGAYEVSSGKKTRGWSVPSHFQSPKMIQGIMSNGNVLVKDDRSAAIALDPSTGEFTPVDIPLSTKSAISPDGSHLAGLHGMYLRIWRIEENAFHMVSEKELNDRPATLAWNQDSRSLIVLVGGRTKELWRYDIASDGEVSSTHVLSRKHIYIESNSLIRSESRVWDLRTGRKILPLHEVWDPLDETSHLPLGERHPAGASVR
jgi:hypothetical protein